MKFFFFLPIAPTLTYMNFVGLQNVLIPWCVPQVVKVVTICTKYLHNRPILTK